MNSTHNSLRFLPLSFAIKSALLAVSTIVITAPAAYAASAEQSLYQINSGTLTEVLNAFAMQSDVLFSADAQVTNGLKSSGLTGKYTIEQGFRTILAPHNLDILPTPQGYKIIRKVATTARDMGQLRQIDVNTTSTTSQDLNAMQLPIITVIADSSTTEGTGSYTTGKMRTATKLDLSIRETPQSVSVISSQMLEDQKIDDFQTLMNHVTGVNSNSSADPRKYYYSRGFYMDYYQVDGIPVFQNTYTVNNQNIDKFDRIEVVKGANGLTTGAGNPGAAINMVRKHANSKEFTGNVSVNAGSWDTYKVSMDLSTPLNQEGRIRGRLVSSYKDAHSFQEQFSREDSLVYGVVDIDITDHTTLSMGASYELDDRDGDINKLPPFYSDGTRTSFSRSKNYSLNWESWDTETISYFSDIKHIFENDITLNAAYTHNEIKTKDRLNASIYGNLNQDGSGLYVSWFNIPQKIKEDNLDIYTSIPFDFANRQHEVITGIQYNESNAVQKRGSLGNFNIDDFFNQNGGEIEKPNLITPSYQYEDNTKQTAAYINAKFELSEDLKLISGARITNWEYQSNNASRIITSSYKNDNVFTPFLGLVYDIGANHSLYTSYTDIFKPQNYKDQSGKLLDPVEGNNYEIGIKGEYFDGALNAALTLFKIEQDNFAERIDGVFVDGTGDTENAYRGVKGVTSKGFEIDVSGKINDQWDISAGFAHFEAKEANNTRINTTIPRNNLNVFTKYTINDLSIGAGLNWNSKSYAEYENLRIDRDDYMLINLMASYKINQNLSGQININNLLDKHYYSGFDVDTYAWGDPRNATISLKYQF